MNLWVLLVTWLCRTLMLPPPVTAQGPSFCKFPFTYKGVTYTACTTKDDPAGRSWCSIKTDSTGNHIGQGNNWRHCEDCGSNLNSDRVVGGEDATLGLHPWMVIFKAAERSVKCENKHQSCAGWAVLGECQKNPIFMLDNCRFSCNNCPSARGQSFWSCGGSLISPQLVLSAAHCFQPNIEIEFARIGELDLNNDPDRGNGLTAPSPQNIPIEIIINHPQYNKPCKNCNDIAIVKLSRPAKLHQFFVAPICLPDYPEKDMGFPVSEFQGKLGIATGWGITDSGTTATILQQAQLDIQELDFCRMFQRVFPDSRMIICAGDGRDGKDTCRGDSGGPLMLTDNFSQKWFIVGVTSFGPTNCGQPDTQGIYTSVHHYIDWIHKTMKSNTVSTSARLGGVTTTRLTA